MANPRSIAWALLLGSAGWAPATFAQQNVRFVSERGVLRNISAGESVEVDLVGTLSGEFDFTVAPGSPTPEFLQVWSVQVNSALLQGGKGNTYWLEQSIALVLSYDRPTGTGHAQFNLPVGYLDYDRDPPNLLGTANLFTVYIGLTNQMVYQTNSPPLSYQYSLPVTVQGVTPAAFLMAYDRWAPWGNEATVELRVAQPPTTTVTYDLHSTDTTILSVPASVTLQPGQISVPFAASLLQTGSAYVTGSLASGGAPYPGTISSQTIRVQPFNLFAAQGTSPPYPPVNPGFWKRCTHPSACPCQSMTLCGICVFGEMPTAPPQCAPNPLGYGCINPGACLARPFSWCSSAGTTPVTSCVWQPDPPYEEVCGSIFVAGDPGEPGIFLIYTRKCCVLKVTTGSYTGNAPDCS